MNKLEIGDRVYSSEVPLLDNNGVYTKKQLELVSFLPNGKLKLIYFSEKESRPTPEFYTVSEESIIFISKTRLHYKGPEDDPFFDRQSKK